MGLKVVIDGYNLIHATLGAGHDIEAARHGLIERVSIYARMKQARVTVVFDAMGRGRLMRQTERIRGVDVVYTRAGESADSLIKEMARKTGSGLTVVTSDRELCSFVEKTGAVVFSSHEFGSRLDDALYADMKGGDIDGSDEDYPRVNKKGASKRPSKKERQKLQRLKKL
ncbi:MAG: NYN domain-containing protein [Deltaproteobacteria bacterium]|nr:NYN domain-containing protein [Deltaproteobacteria bacterium]